MTHRPRRLRQNAAFRELVSETHLRAEQLILPVFIKEGLTTPKPIAGLPGVVQHTPESLALEADLAVSAGIAGIMVFGVPDQRDAAGSEACNPEGILSSTVRTLRQQVGDHLLIIADLCLDEFTDHGHCGVLDENGNVDNDRTLEVYAQMAVVLAQAGAHMLGTSGMMDGQVAAVRNALDKAGFTDVAILAYAAKYASAFYGPFRDAVESQLEGDRKTYQQDTRNIRESLREVRLDAEEGADIIMIKPGLPYLDVIAAAHAEVDLPIATYVVSGETAMIEAAASAGVVDRQAGIMEVLTSVRRAGASIICTYWALEVSSWLRQRG